jgi:hypothetical protein
MKKKFLWPEDLGRVYDIIPRDIKYGDIINILRL